jgi:hypothetical protein
VTYDTSRGRNPQRHGLRITLDLHDRKQDHAMRQHALAIVNTPEQVGRDATWPVASQSQLPRPTSDLLGATSQRFVTSVLLLFGAAMVATSGLIHIYLWADGYRNIATIGPLFLAQGAVGLVFAVSLVGFPRLLTTIVSAGYLLASIGALALSTTRGLFGFMDTLDAPWARTTLIVESLGVLLLALGVVAIIARPKRMPPLPSSPANSKGTQ